jgi:hypothetical protein
VQAGAGDDRVMGDVGNDHLEGWSGDDVITGGLGDDVIYGHAGDDQINGGQDTLYAGRKAGAFAYDKDRLYGGSDWDRFLQRRGPRRQEPVTHSVRRGASPPGRRARFSKRVEREAEETTTGGAAAVACHDRGRGPMPRRKSRS